MLAHARHCVLLWQHHSECEGSGWVAQLTLRALLSAQCTPKCPAAAGPGTPQSSPTHGLRAPLGCALLCPVSVCGSPMSQIHSDCLLSAERAMLCLPASRRLSPKMPVSSWGQAVKHRPSGLLTTGSLIVHCAVFKADTLNCLVSILLSTSESHFSRDSFISLFGSLCSSHDKKAILPGKEDHPPSNEQ